MGPRRRTLCVGFLVALFLGVAVYFRLWAMDDEPFTADDRDALRRQFERANMDAMDESAEWRMKYDVAAEKSKQFEDELLKVKAAFTTLQKANMDLGKQVESLKQQIEQQCNCSRSTTQRR